MNTEQIEKYCAYCHDKIREERWITSHADQVYHPECFELLAHYHYYDEFNEEFKD